MTSTEASDEKPELTAVQIIELQRFEALILENLRRGKKPTVSRTDANGIRTAAFNVADMDTPAEQERTKRHIELTAELVCYLAAEGIDHRHFRGRLNGADFILAYQACWILRQRREHFEEPDSFGYAVLTRAGFRPPGTRSANP